MLRCHENSSPPRRRRGLGGGGYGIKLAGQPPPGPLLIKEGNQREHFHLQVVSRRLMESALSMTDPKVV
jgi:hypothetical protein